MSKRPARRISTPSKQETETERVTRPKVDRSRLGANPFESSLVVPSSRVVMKGQYRMDGGDLLENEVVMDRAQKVSVFISANLRVAAMNLNPSTLKLLVWVMYETEYGLDYVWVNVPRFLKESGISKATYKAAVESLCRYGYMYPVVGHPEVYWINPSVMFNGSRVSSFPRRVV